MIAHFIKFLARTFWKQRLYSALNLIGLVLGLSVSFIIYLYVSSELNVDKHLSVNPNTFRLLRQGDLNGSPYLIGVTSGPFAEALPVDFPQDVNTTLRVLNSRSWVRYEDNMFYENNFSLVDSTFFEVFNYDLEKGDKATALNGLNNLIITKEMARKYFGDDDPINKVIRVDDEYDMIVTGVLAETEYSSHMRIDFLGNIGLVRDRPWFTRWWNNNLITYVVLNEESNFRELNAQFPQFMDKYFGEDFAANKNRIDILLQPLEEVYFENNVRYDSVLHGNKNTVYIFSGIGIFILLIAIINFVNLATAKSVSRAREVGIKKVMGSTRRQLIVQFLCESAILSGVALMISLMLVEISLPFFNLTYGLSLAFDLTGALLFKISLFLIAISLLSGLYPAFILSSFSSISVLKGKVKNGPGAARFRKALVTVQFAISTFLIIGTLLVGKQLNYINSKPLGFDKDAIIIIRSNNQEFFQQREAFKNTLLSNSAIGNVCIMVGEPGGFHDTMSMLVEGIDQNPRMRTNFVDHNFVETFDLQLAAGRSFSKDFGSDFSSALMLNETAVKELGWTPEEAVGKRMQIQMVDTTMKTVVGVLKDFHFASLKTPIEPLVLSLSEDGGTIGIKINSSDLSTTLADVEKAWTQIAPKYPFQFQFLDDRLARSYENEKLQGSLFTLFSFISIIVAALGIVGLATYSSTQRLKEIGVRKILGASSSGLSLLLMRDLVFLTFISTLVAWPFAYWMIQEWLSSFAYKVDPGFGYFILASAITLVIAIASVSYQSIRVALVNPIDVIKED
ncbi:MAG: FtsX-like permease family protein [Cyclobacteriaceae bacterium]